MVLIDKRRQQLSQSLEPTRLDDDNLSETVYGTSDVKFIIKPCPISNKPKYYNHLLVFEKLLKNGFIRLVNCQLEKDDKIISIKYRAIKLKDTELEQLVITVSNPDGNTSRVRFDHLNITTLYAGEFYEN